MNVLSLFDGMGCARLALERSGIPVTKYYACEIDKHAIKVTSTKNIDTIHLGSVTDLKVSTLGHIDIILAGSPCQGFSFAGKQLAFDDPRSILFFEFVRILNEVRAINPNVLFLLENVRMKKEHEDVISRILGIQPININSTLVSAQNRERLYWANIAMGRRGLFGDNYCTIPQPKDKGILLKDILQTNVDEKYYLSDKAVERILKVGVPKQYSSIDGGKTVPLLARVYANTNGLHVSEPAVNDYLKIDKTGAIKANQHKASCFTAGAHSGGNHSDMDLIVEPVCGAMRGRYSEGWEQQLEIAKDGKTNTLTSVQKDNLVVTPNTSKGNRVKESDGKADCLLGSGGGGGAKTGLWKVGTRIRRLTPVECCRLQNVPDDYFLHEGNQIVSESQQYKMLGNGWTIDVISHILSHI